MNEFKLLKGYTDPMVEFIMSLEKLNQTLEQWNESLVRMNESLSRINNNLNN